MIRSFRCLLAASSMLVPVAPALADDADMADQGRITVTGARPEAPVDATKTGAALIDTPQSIAILDRQQLDNQAIESLNDALRYVPGVILSNGEGNRDQVAIRGQSSTADFFLDGLRDDAQYYRPLFNTERIEVLKGANALLFGRGGGGGVINRVTKTPVLGTSTSTLSAGADTFGAWSIAADTNQPLGEGVVLRLNGTYEAFANNRDVFDGRFIGVAPTLGLRLGDATRLTLFYEYDDDRRVADRGVPSVGGLPIAGYDQTFFGDPPRNRSKVHAHIARARLEHDFSDSLSVNFSALYGNYDKAYWNVQPSGATATTVTLSGYTSATQRENAIGQGNLVWKAGTGPVKSTLLAGFEATRQDSTSTRANALFATPPTVPLARTITVPAVTWSALTNSSTSRVTALSAYVQDQLEIGEHLQLIAGLRYDDFKISTLNRILAFAAERQDGKWSPRFGVIVKPVANLSLYASYSRGFLPQSGDQFSVLDATTATLAPESFRNLEAGVKWDVRPGLAFTAAVFQLDRDNTRASDPITNLPVLTGASRVKGFELALAGQITPEWQANLGYSYQEGKILSTTTAAKAGQKLPLLPRAQITAWTRYAVTPRLGLGLGLVHQASQYATISNKVTLPTFTRLDAAINYKVSERLLLQLNVENLTDTRYYASANADFNIMPGDPLNARLTARVRF